MYFKRVETQPPSIGDTCQRCLPKFCGKKHLALMLNDFTNSSIMTTIGSMGRTVEFTYMNGGFLW